MIAEGSLGADGVFAAREVLAKHDENYMPPEVAKALKEVGQWKESERHRRPTRSAAQAQALVGLQAVRQLRSSRCDSLAARLRSDDVMSRSSNSATSP